MFKKIIIIFLATFMFACSSNYHTKNQVANGAYLQLEGDFIHSVMIIDEQKVVLADVKTFTENGKRVARFPISEGNHKISIMKDNIVIIKQAFFTANDETFRILVR